MPISDRKIIQAQYNQKTERVEAQIVTDFISEYTTIYEVSVNEAVKAILHAGVKKLRDDLYGGQQGSASSQQLDRVIEMLNHIGVAVTVDLPTQIANLQHVAPGQPQQRTGAQVLTKENARGGMSDQEIAQVTAALEQDEW